MLKKQLWMGIHKNQSFALFLVLLGFFSLACSGENSAMPESCLPTQQSAQAGIPFTRIGIDEDETSVQMWHASEFSKANNTWEGNPFDLQASVTFKHRESGASHTTDMFYSGDNIWKFRFTGTKLGVWSFESSSPDIDLDGLKGSVSVIKNPNPDISGFLVHLDNKYALQTKDQDSLQGYLLNVYMNEETCPSYIEEWGENQDTSQYLEEARSNGTEVIFFHINNNWLKFGEKSYVKHDNFNPDLKTFKVLDALIFNTHQQGGRVVLWAWGDDAKDRKWTPTGVLGGINGEVDLRLQRYIAARLGPLPGWSMGYGFDLQEWVTEEEIRVWADNLSNMMGWPHLLWARGRKNPSLSVISYSLLGPFMYSDTVQLLDKDLQRPHFFGERFTYKRNGIFTMDLTRRLFWQYTMAGGMGSFWGFFNKEYGKADPLYPNPEQLRTHYSFWHIKKRFLLDMNRANHLSDAYVLASKNNKNLVAYKEDTDFIEIDLSNMPTPSQVIAVNTKNEYKEINLGALAAKKHTIRFSVMSDWALAVGSFRDEG